MRLVLKYELHEKRILATLVYFHTRPTSGQGLLRRRGGGGGIRLPLFCHFGSGTSHEYLRNGLL